MGEPDATVPHRKRVRDGRGEMQWVGRALGGQKSTSELGPRPFHGKRLRWTLPAWESRRTVPHRKRARDGRLRSSRWAGAGWTEVHPASSDPRPFHGKRSRWALPAWESPTQPFRTANGRGTGGARSSRWGWALGGQKSTQRAQTRDRFTGNGRAGLSQHGRARRNRSAPQTGAGRAGRDAVGGTGRWVDRSPPSVLGPATVSRETVVLDSPSMGESDAPVPHRKRARDGRVEVE
ncbi:uncharacterized protein B0H18DRAFT_1123413 [Fomitopsis serialis]|uniref:uncharacterized protein n=1 Tax=Fomitopsis serialis TaxID=139415 RepID=UPI0020080EE3|nr:uncharacterized protein B0H18DRAFT_1123413 [Neoantrodia serialis]KAH9917798.1 hypothetical protein B0H18DRAFT_1123413 [Neoantrodia serialis]